MPRIMVKCPYTHDIVYVGPAFDERSLHAPAAGERFKCAACHRDHVWNELKDRWLERGPEAYEPAKEMADT